MSAAKYSGDLINKAAELRASGMSLTAIAVQLGMPKSTVGYQGLRLGADTPATARTVAAYRGPMKVSRNGHVVRRFSDDEDCKITKMEKAGLPMCAELAVEGATAEASSTRATSEVVDRRGDLVIRAGAGADEGQLTGAIRAARAAAS